MLKPRFVLVPTNGESPIGVFGLRFGVPFDLLSNRLVLLFVFLFMVSGTTRLMSLVQHLVVKHLPKTILLPLVPLSRGAHRSSRRYIISRVSLGRPLVPLFGSFHHYCRCVRRRDCIQSRCCCGCKFWVRGRFLPGRTAARAWNGSFPAAA